MIMSLLAAPAGHRANSSLEKDDLAELFLSCIDDPALQEVILLAAVPPAFNKDVLDALLAHQKINIETEWVLIWLLNMPFIEPRSDGWRYNKNVRRSFLAYQRQRSPETYREIHAELARFHQNSGRLPPWK